MLVVKEGALFACSRPDGDISAERAPSEGLYFDDARYLSELRLSVDGREAALVASSSSLGYEATIELTAAEPSESREPADRMTLGLRRVRRIAAGRLYERIEIRNRGPARVETEIAVALAADFADIFEVRNIVQSQNRTPLRAPVWNGEELRLGHLGVDNTLRETIVELGPPPVTVDASSGRAEARWPLNLAPREGKVIDIVVEPSFEGRRSARLSFEAAGDHAAAAALRWTDSCNPIVGPRPSYDRVLAASSRDLHSLITPIDDHDIIAAGIPWYVAPFGRDSLITAYEMLLLNSAPARQTLLYLAQHRANTDDPRRDAEPGMILHELRRGPLARGGFIPFNPYYGSVDSTPLFVMLAAAFWRWTTDRETMVELRPALDEALRWIDEFGDLDGDGFIEYRRRSPDGLLNHGWKDSDDAILHSDGTRATGPIALVEVQGYVYMAKHQIAAVYDALGERPRAQTLEREAEVLRKSFNDVFWMPQEGTFALALDGRKRRVETVSSNAGQCLFTGIVDEDKAASVAHRLMAPDMFSGWGIRTMSSDFPAFDPRSYHNGSVWPHDNAIIAAGLKRYGFSDATEVIATAIFDAALQAPDASLPELFCGFDRTEGTPYVPYPVACRPQAWAAAAPFMLLQALGNEPF